MASDLIRQALVFAGPGKLTVEQEAVPEPAGGQVTLTTLVSLISAGTELLAYRGTLPDGINLDSTIAGLDQKVSYPLRYGYSCVAVVDKLGPGVDQRWDGQRVFAFHPHASHMTLSVDDILPVPEALSTEDAAFLANLETAINLLHDARPLLGDRLLVVGQGVVGLLTTALAARSDLEAIIACDPISARLEQAREWGATHTVRPEQAEKLLAGDPVDVAIELSGTSAGLQAALNLTQFSGRVVIGSWYGTKPVQLDLGTRFHRSRQEVVASQVSTVRPAISGRWTKSRRLTLATRLAQALSPSGLVTHRFKLDQAERAYRLLSESRGNALAVMFDFRPKGR